MQERVQEAESKNINILPDEDEEREMYYLTEKMLEEKGYVHYEISNYGKPGFQCRHNIGYWKRVDYLALVWGQPLYITTVDTVTLKILTNTLVCF